MLFRSRQLLLKFSRASARWDAPEFLNHAPSSPGRPQSFAPVFPFGVPSLAVAQRRAAALPFRRRSAWDSHFKRIHSCDPGCRARAVERAFTRSRRDRTDAQRGQLLHDIFFWLSGLSTNILTNSPLDLKKELTSTLLALREQSIVHVQLKRITSYLRILQNAVRRLKGLPCQEPRPTV